jgi:hypothetical protein
MFKKWNKSSSKGSNKGATASSSDEKNTSFEEVNQFNQNDLLKKKDGDATSLQQVVETTTTTTTTSRQSEFSYRLDEYRRLLDKKKLQGGSSISTIKKQCSDAAKLVLFEGIQQARQSYRAGKLHKVVNEVLIRRSQIQSYDSSKMLALAYNEANVFDVHKVFDGKVIHPEFAKPIINRYRDDLIIVARKVVDAFCQRHNPSPEQILELAELAISMSLY